MAWTPPRGIKRRQFAGAAPTHVGGDAGASVGVGDDWYAPQAPQDPGGWVPPGAPQMQTESRGVPPRPYQALPPPDWGAAGRGYVNPLGGTPVEQVLNVPSVPARAVEAGLTAGAFGGSPTAAYAAGPGQGYARAFRQTGVSDPTLAAGAGLAVGMIMDPLGVNPEGKATEAASLALRGSEQAGPSSITAVDALRMDLQRTLGMYLNAPETSDADHLLLSQLGAQVGRAHTKADILAAKDAVDDYHFRDNPGLREALAESPEETLRTAEYGYWRDRALKGEKPPEDVLARFPESDLASTYHVRLMAAVRNRLALLEERTRVAGLDTLYQRASSLTPDQLEQFKAMPDEALLGFASRSERFSAELDRSILTPETTPWTGPTSKQDVGAGADLNNDGYDDQTGLPVWMQSAANVAGFVANPLGGLVRGAATAAAQETQQAAAAVPPAWQQAPVLGAVQAVNVPFAAPQGAGEYLAGAAIGGMQAASEVMGVNPSNQPLDVRSRAAAIPVPGVSINKVPLPGGLQADIPNPANPISLDLAHPAGTLAGAYGPLDTPDRPKEMPPVQSPADITDPAQAVQRYKASTPPLLDAATGMLLGGAGYGVAAQGLAEGAGLAARATGLADALTTSRSALHPLGGPGEQFANAVAQATENNKTLQTLGNLTRIGSVLGGAGWGGYEGYQAMPEHPSPLEKPLDYVVGVGMPALTVGSVLGLGAYLVPRTALTLAKTGAWTDLPKVPEAYPAGLKAMLVDQRTAIAAGRPVPNVLQYTGGWWGLLRDNLLRELSSDKAPLESMQGADEYRRLRGLSAEDAEKELATTRAAVADAATAHAGIATEQQQAWNEASARSIEQRAAKAQLDAQQAVIDAAHQQADVSADPAVAAAQATRDQARADLAAAKQARTARGLMPENPQGAQERALSAAEGAYNAAVKQAKDAHPDVTAAQAAAEATKQAHDAAAAATREAEIKLSAVGQRRLDVQGRQDALAERQRVLESAVAGRDEPYTFGEQFAGRSQLLAGQERVREDQHNRIAKLVLRRRTVNDAPLGTRPDGTPIWEDPAHVDAGGNVTPYEIGLTKDETASSGPFNTFLRLVAMKQRIEAGRFTLMRDLDPVTGRPRIVPEGAILTPADADARMQEFVDKVLGGDAGQAERFRNTLDALTREHNARLDWLADRGVLGPDDVAAMKREVLSYINVQQVDSMLHDWRNGKIPQDRRMFAASRGVDPLSGDDGLLNISLDQNLQRDDKLITLGMLNENGRTLMRAAALDPTVARNFERYVLPEDTEVRVREKEIEGEDAGTDPATGLPLSALPSSGVAPGLRQRHADLAWQHAQAETTRDRATAALDRAQNSIILHTKNLADREAARDAFVQQVGSTPSAAADIQRLRELNAQVYATRTALKKAGQRAPISATARDTAAAQVADLGPRADEAKARLGDATGRLADLKKTLADRAGDAMHEITTRKDGRQAIWPVLVDGEWRPYLVPRWLWEMGAGMDEQQFPRLLGLFSKHVSGFERAAVTSWSPSFLFANPIRDFQTAFHNYAHPGEFLANYLPAWADAWGAALDPAWLHIVDGLRDRPVASVGGLRAALDAKAGRAVRRMTAEPEEGGRYVLSAGRHGGGLGTLHENIAPGRTHDIEGRFEWGLGNVLDSVPAAYRTMGTVFENTTRTAIYMAEHERLGVPKLAENVRDLERRVAEANALGGDVPPDLAAELSGAKQRLDNARAEGAYNYRTITTDFSRAGHGMRFLNSFMPLLNARAQGTYQTWRSAQEDPRGYVGRLTASAVIPFLLTYAWNRSQFGDHYDAIGDATKDRNAVIITHTYVDSRDGREKPFYLKIPLDDVASTATMLMRDALDREYHQADARGQPLAPDQRTNRPMATTLKAIIANWLPMNPRPDQLDPNGIIQASASMIPVFGVATQMWANQDEFTGQPIYDPNAGVVVPNLEYATSTNNQSLMGIWGAQHLHDLGITGAATSPAGVDYMLRGVLGSLEQAPFAYGWDQMLRVLGYKPPVALTAADLGVGPDVPREAYAKYLNWQQQNDPRPLLAQVYPRFFGAGGGAQAILAKARDNNPQDYHAWQDSLGYMQGQDAYTQTTFQDMRKRVFEHPDPSWTNARIMSEAQNLWQQRKGYLAGLKQKFPAAITDPNERQAFIARQPGIPVGAEDAGALMMLPPGTDITALAERYWTPPGVDLSTLNPIDQENARNAELQKMAAELTTQGGRTISESTVRAAVAAAENGLSFPSLPVPETYRNEWISRYMAPAIPDAVAAQYGTDFQALPTPIQASLRRAELGTIVREQNLVKYFTQDGDIKPDDPNPEGAAQDLLLRGVINPGLLPVGQQYPAEQEKEQALWVSSHIHDDAHFAPYVDPTGTAVGTPELWHQWDQQLARAATEQPNKKRWSPLLKTLDMLHSWGDVAKVNALYSDPNYLAYARYFGIGRTLTPDQWDQVKSGEAPRYFNPQTGQALDAQAQFQVDHLLSLYAALPVGPEKRRLNAAVRFIRKRMTVPAWKDRMNLDDVQPDALRAIDDQVRSIDAEAQAQDEQAAQLQQ